MTPAQQRTETRDGRTPIGAKTVRTRIPARRDRLPRSRFQWRIVIGLGTVGILDN
jgi:hypothetical protein